MKHIKHLMSLSNAARRLLETIAAIEAREGKAKREVTCSDEGEVREKVLQELKRIDTIVKELDNQYEDLRYDFELNI